MPDENPQPTNVLTTSAVRWGIDTLGAQKVHPTFLPYLYLRVQQRAGTLATASVAAPEFRALLDMPGNPTRPYYAPLMDRGERTGELLNTFWKAQNLSGSWSPASITRGAPWLTTGSAYVLPDDHVQRALQEMLYDIPVSALAMGCYFLRNDGFVLEGEPESGDIIAAFRTKFDFSASAGHEFAELFTEDLPGHVDFEWFEPADSLTAPEEPVDV